MPLDEERLNRQVQTALNDFGAAAHAPLVVIGDELGLYEALADAGPLTSVGLAQKSDTAERYVREWLRAQAGESGVRDAVTDGGFSHLRRAAETPLSLVFEAKP